MLPKSSIAATIAIGAIGAIGILASDAALSATTTTTTISVGATLVDHCLISATALTFQPYSPGSGAVTGTSTVTLRCTNGAIYAVGLSAGSTAGTSMSQRLLASGSNTLQYNLYTSNTYNNVWGDGSGGSAVVAGYSSGFASPIALTVYGQVPDSAANKLVPAGIYNDSIIVVLSY
jgi:spore coat protein U-like protein